MVDTYDDFDDFLNHYYTLAKDLDGNSNHMPVKLFKTVQNSIIKRFRVEYRVFTYNDKFEAVNLRKQSKQERDVMRKQFEQSMLKIATKQKDTIKEKKTSKEV